MDRILTDKVKVVYDNWINFNGNKQCLANGLHPKVIEMIQNKLDEYSDLHKAVEETNKEITGDSFAFDHSNFWGYTVNQLEFIEVDQIDTSSDVIYIWPIETKGSLNSLTRKLTVNLHGEEINYKFFEAINPRSLELIREGKIKIVINLAQDPVFENVLFDIEVYFSKVANIDPSNVVFIIGNDYRDEYKKLHPWAKLKISPAEMLITQQYAQISFSYPRMTSLGYTSELVTESDLDKTKIRPHKFLCLNRTMKPHRYVLAYHALKNNLLKNNIYTFLNSFGADEESIHNCLTRFYEDTNELWDYAKQIKNLMPYEVDTMGLTESERASMVADNNKKEIYANTYVNIVSETGFIMGEKPFLSEKIWKPVINLQPFILVGNYHTLKQIKDLGFKTFHPFIDESYDEVYDYKERMKMVLKEIDKINAMPIEQIHEWYYSITDVLIHNRTQLKTFKDINPYQVVIDDIINTYRGLNGI